MIESYGDQKEAVQLSNCEQYFQIFILLFCVKEKTTF